jgi:hypothetical protein
MISQTRIYGNYNSPAGTLLIYQVGQCTSWTQLQQFPLQEDVSTIDLRQSLKA